MAIYKTFLLFLIFIIAPSYALAARYKTVHMERKGASYDVTVAYPQFPSGSQGSKANLAIKLFAHSLFESDLRRFKATRWTKEEIKDSVNPDALDISVDKVIVHEDRISIYFVKVIWQMFAAHPVHTEYHFNYSFDADTRVIRR